LNLGLCFFKLRIFKRVLEEFETAYKYDNNCLDAIYNKGLTLISMKKYREALDTLMFFKKASPDEIEVMFHIAHCYCMLRDYEEANIWVNNLLAVNPRH
jgi:tetratricopeptide (TPR) repeat protein